MATVSIVWDNPGAQFDPLGSNYPQPVRIAGTNFPVEGLAFDAATVESSCVKFTAVSYGSGNLTLKLRWYADTASTGSVVWSAAIAAITPDTDSQDVETKGFATANTVTDAHLGTTGQREHTCSITISNLDSLAAGDTVWLRLRRDATDGSDDMSGDAILLSAILEYSDT